MEEELANENAAAQIISFEGKKLLLVDDIVTTGATIIACGRELAKAPGVSISILSLGFTKS